MIKNFRERYPIIREMILYGIIGGGSALLDTLFYVLFTRVFTWPDLLSNFLSVNIGIAVSFCLNTYFNFKKHDRLKQRAVSFFCVGYAGLLLSTGLLFFGVQILHFDDLLIKIVSIFIVAAFQFVLNKLITYGKIGSAKGTKENG